ncbi:hypothetical protein BU24DRAFT_355539 [Aaosphaeria arxii CBS 175.79]|uniref:DUF4045 domain-containing protein n=1 Tax=Aaosphaeria arxii CBS 175.79 TaxID=1450172 RepID=A0A6A5XE49_9PLEO|nr:uncharacterized protein BU24DRAFT_355539 [Aaosphaeria arxii CBS 175.79]KAF2011153.1 hypothetical protein BU24DRAFT_355539 [Aaosphaeria arxii CBS 175.79]
MEPPSQESAREDSLQRLTGSPAQALEDEEPKKPAPSAAALGRSGTLSWQQRRPQSVGVRRPLSSGRPLSGASTPAEKMPAASPRDTPEPGSPAESTTSRTQIAQALGAKDPSWFKQTADRGIGSAAYRRSQEDTASDAGSVSGKRQLPGMSRESTVEPESISPPPESGRSSSPSRGGSVRGSVAWSNRFSANTSISGGDTEPSERSKTPLPVLDSQKFAPPSEQGSSVGGGDQGSIRGLAMSPTQGRISPERPASPTKGMGGFVQSAMLKRSDSVNKRWSTQTPQGLTRQNSTLSNRGSAMAGYGSLSKASGALPEKPEFVKPALPHHNRSKSVASTFSEDKPQDETSPPSPSKRWSPTKSSWLENALNKPESPKIKQAPPQQPSWMAELNRKKQQRGSVDLGKGSPDLSPFDSVPSGRTSPIKDVQLRPVSLRRPDSPLKQEAPKPIEPSAKPKPLFSPKVVTSPKPTTSPKPKITAREEPKEEREPEPELKPKPIPIPKEDITSKEEDTQTSTSTPATTQASKLSTSSPAPKPKPQTPPKKDFRSNLKARAAAFEAPKTDQKAEFQNVFGRLKKTETKNYVAPDTLKDNILRGKKDLSITGGPKPTVRKDEFKESLITKKAAMLVKAQETGSAAHKKTDSTSSQPAALPEAIARRKTLGQSDKPANVPAPVERQREGTPEAISRKKSLRAMKPVAQESQAASPTPLGSKEPAKSSKLANRFNPALAGILARGPPGASKGPSGSDSDIAQSASSPAIEEKKGPAPELTHMTKGRAKGPRRRAPAKGASAGASAEKKESIPSKPSPVATVPLVKTEDILPSTGFTTASPSEDPSLIRTPARESLKAKPVTPLKSPDLTKKLEKSQSPEVPRKSASLDKSPTTSLEAEVAPKKSLDAESVEPSKPVTSPKPTTWRGSRPLPPPKDEPSREATESSSPVKEDPSPTKLGFSVRGATALWGRPSPLSSPTTAGAKTPIKLPTRADEEAAMENAGLTRSPPPDDRRASPSPQAPKPKPAGLGLGSLASLGGLVAAKSKSRESSPPKPLTAKPLPSTPSSSDRPQSEPFKASPMPDKATGLFAEFFDETPVLPDELPASIDTNQILKTAPFDLGPAGKIRTLRKQIQEITGDGKLLSVPMAEEHVLYQDSMYVCTHIFGDSKGARNTEVYLWSGNGVADATLEDVQLFGRNIAKQNQGKLFVLRQGKETPNFFEALGGIVITRRGSPPSNREYMLCGRRHLGHIAFDEVDFTLKSLCSGFAYIISTESGKVFLWKGRGCSAEELSAARLMGMDLAPTGDFNEIDEGSEPASLFTVFPPADPTSKAPLIPRSADHWKYKSTSDRYRARLFRIEQQHETSGWGQSLQVSSFFAPLLRRPSWQSFSSSAPNSPPSDAKAEQAPQTPVTPRSPLPQITTKVVEVMPFCQHDLEPEHIYVLDAFFEVIVGSLSRNQSVAFANALMFAQEYGMLAVSEEDRPFMPVSTVVLEGVPRDMKAVFRFWDDALIPAAGLMQGKLGRGKSLRIVGLSKAIEATRPS